MAVGVTRRVLGQEPTPRGPWRSCSQARPGEGGAARLPSRVSAEALCERVAACPPARVRGLVCQARAPAGCWAGSVLLVSHTCRSLVKSGGAVPRTPLIGSAPVCLLAVPPPAVTLAGGSWARPADSSLGADNSVMLQACAVVVVQHVNTLYLPRVRVTNMGYP